MRPHGEAPQSPRHQIQQRSAAWESHVVRENKEPNAPSASGLPQGAHTTSNALGDPNADKIAGGVGAGL